MPVNHFLTETVKAKEPMEAVMTHCDAIFDKYIKFFDVSQKPNSWSGLQELVEKTGVDGLKKTHEATALVNICIANLKEDDENEMDINNVSKTLGELNNVISKFQSLLNQYKKDIPEVNLLDSALQILGDKIAGYVATKMLIMTLHQSQKDYERGKNYLTAEEFISAK